MPGQTYVNSSEDDGYRGANQTEYIQSSRNHDNHRRRDPSSNYEASGFMPSESILAGSLTTFAPYIDPISDNPVAPVRAMRYGSGGFDGVAQLNRPQITFETGERYQYPQLTTGVNRVNDNVYRRGARRPQTRGRYNRGGRRGNNRKYRRYCDLDDNCQLDDRLFVNCSSTDEEDDEERDMIKLRRKEQRARRQKAANAVSLSDESDSEKDEKTVWRAESDDRATRRQKRLKQHLAYINDMKKKGTLMVTVGFRGQKTVEPADKVARNVARFDAKRERVLLQKLSGPPQTLLTVIGSLNLRYDKNKAILNETQSLADAAMDFEEKQNNFKNKVNDELEKQLNINSIKFEELRCDGENLDAMNEGVEKVEKQEQHKRNIKMMDQCSTNVQRMISSTGSIDCGTNVNCSSADESSNTPKIEWPSALLVSEQTISSRDISTFLCRSKDDNYAPYDAKANRLLETLECFSLDCESKKKYYDENALSVLVDFNLKEPELKARGDQYLRPVLIDGCGVAYAYDREFSPLFDSPTAHATFLQSKILPVYPIANLTLRLILMGHQTRIILPKFYETPYYTEQKRLKVDNLDAFNKLVELRIISFWEPDGHTYTDIMAMLKAQANHVGAAIITDPSIECYYDKLRNNPAYEPLDLEEGNFKDEKEMEEFRNNMKKDRMNGNCSDRPLSVCFHSVRKDMYITREFNYFVGDAADHERRKNNYCTIDEEMTLLYTELAGDVHCESKRLGYQLMFSEQVAMVVGLCSIYELTRVHLWATMLFLRFAFKAKLKTPNIDNFVEENMPFQPPTADINEFAELNLTEQEITNKKKKERLQREKKAWKQKIHNIKKEISKWRKLATELGIQQDDSDNELTLQSDVPINLNNLTLHC